MGGRASLFLVLGFSLIFMIAGRYFNQMATDTTTNLANYYYDAKTHQIASSGVNVLMDQLFFDATFQNGSYNYNFDGGTISTVLSTLDSYRNIRQIVSTGSLTTGDGHTYSTTIKVVLQPTLFSKFAYFSNDEGSNIYWTSKDTVWGPFHTNDDLYIAYNPVFFGQVSIGGKEIKSPSSSKAKYLDGFKKNINIAIPTTGVSNVATQATTGGVQITGHSLVYFEFRSDSIRYRYSTSGAWTYKLASTFAPNGVIYFSNAEVHLSGTVKGSYTIATSGSSGNQGSIFLDNDIVYKNNPVTNPNSTDMLGIVAQKNVYVTDNTNNNTNGIKINASIYCQEGSFTAQNYSTRPAAGFIDLYGGITQNVRGAVGTFTSDWWGNTYIDHGFSKRYRYDDRLLTSYPPAYPGCGTFEVVSWFE